MQHLHKKLQELGGAYKSITCLNSHNLPDSDFFNVGLPIVAADGALNRLMERGVVPNMVIGDLDSAEERYLAQVKSWQILDQNTSDFEKTIAYLQDQNLLPTLVLGVGGGCLDHVLYNTGLLMRHKLMFYDKPIMGLVLEQTRSFQLPFHTKLSLLGNAVVSTEGLKWNLSRTKLTFPGQSSCFNRSVGDEVIIHVEHGCVMLLIYLEPISDAGSKD